MRKRCEKQKTEVFAILKNISSLLSPELIAAIYRLGHGDTVVLADRSFPAGSIAKEGGAKLICADGHGIPGLLQEILKLMLLDTYADKPVMLMDKLPCDADMDIPIWEIYRSVISRHDRRKNRTIGYYERFEFYAQAKKASCIIKTGETSGYANIILKAMGARRLKTWSPDSPEDGIPAIMSAELAATLCEMGHGDTVVLGDGNFPAGSIAGAGGAKLIRADGHGIPELLDAILFLMPLDTYEDTPVMLMDRLPCDANMPMPVWENYCRIVGGYDTRGRNAFAHCKRSAFYERAKSAYCVVQTGEPSAYANIILQKGAVKAASHE